MRPEPHPAGFDGLSSDVLETIRKGCIIAAAKGKRNGLPYSSEYDTVIRACKSALRSRRGEAPVDPKSVASRPPTSASGTGLSGAAPDWIPTREAAPRLKCTDRHARTIAKKVGRKFGRDWFIPADALPEEESS